MIFGRVKSLDAILATAERKSLKRSLGAIQLTLLGIGSVICFVSMLMASKVGEVEALRLHATELLMLLGTVIVLMVEPPAEKVVAVAETPAPVVPLSLQQPQLVDNR